MLWIDLWCFFKFRRVLKKIGIPLNKGRVASLLPIYKELFDDIAEEYELLPPTTQAAQNFAVIADVIEEEMEMANVPAYRYLCTGTILMT